ACLRSCLPFPTRRSSALGLWAGWRRAAPEPGYTAPPVVAAPARAPPPAGSPPPAARPPAEGRVPVRPEFRRRPRTWPLQPTPARSEEHTSELQSRENLVC